MLALIRSLRTEFQEFANIASRLAIIVRSLTLSVLIGATALLLICLILMTGGVRFLFVLLLTTPLQNLLYTMVLLLILLLFMAYNRIKKKSIVSLPESMHGEISVAPSAEPIQEAESSNLELAQLDFTSASKSHSTIPSSISKNDENVLNLIAVGLPIASHFYAVFTKESRVKKLMAIFLLCSIGVFYFFRRAPTQYSISPSSKSLLKSLLYLLVEYSSKRESRSITKSPKNPFLNSKL